MNKTLTWIQLCFTAS